jgi:hypothetical protein
MRLEENLWKSLNRWGKSGVTGMGFILALPNWAHYMSQ